MQAQPTARASLPEAERNAKGANPMLLTLILILIPTITGVAGQLLLKVGMSQMGALDLSVAAVPSLLMRIVTSPHIVVGLAIYFGGVFFWLLALNRAELSFVYPFASLSYVLIALASWGLLHEHVSPMRWMGLLVICFGVLLVARS